MGTHHVSIPRDLDRTVQERFPDVSMSKILQEGLQRLLGCKHEEVRCAHCASLIDVRTELVTPLIHRLGSDLLQEIYEHSHANRSWDGFAQVARDLLARHGGIDFRPVLQRRSASVRARHQDEAHLAAAAGWSPR